MHLALFGAVAVNLHSYVRHGSSHVPGINFFLPRKSSFPKLVLSWH